MPPVRPGLPLPVPGARCPVPCGLAACL
jgi:hypothetical protein